MKTVLLRFALVVGVTFNVVLVAVHLFMLYMLLSTLPDIIAADSDTPIGISLLGAIYLAPFAISLGIWVAGRSSELSVLARANVFTMAAFYLAVLSCVVVCRAYDIWFDVS